MACLGYTYQKHGDEHGDVFFGYAISMLDCTEFRMSLYALVQANCTEKGCIDPACKALIITCLILQLTNRNKS